jgi:hypothetical protein
LRPPLSFCLLYPLTAHFDWQRFEFATMDHLRTVELPDGSSTIRVRFGRSKSADAIGPRSGPVRTAVGGGWIRGLSCFAGSADHLRE